MSPILKRRLHHALFYAALFLMGTFIVESDIIMGHHEANRLHQARVHYIEEPETEDQEDPEEEIVPNAIQ